MAVETLAVERLTFAESIDFSLRLASLEAGTRLVIDLRRLSFVEPFAMLYFAAAARKFEPVALIDEQSPAYGYAAHMGFFQALGADKGNAPRRLPGKARYAPIDQIDVEALVERARSARRKPAEFITNRAENLARILCHDYDGTVREVLVFAIREMMRNVIEHSGAESIWCAAQLWPELGRAEIAILDEGIGMRASLARNPLYQFGSDQGALNAALLPGVSGGTSGKNGNSFFSNSGYGLYVTRRLCALGGSFFAATCTAGVLDDAHGTKSVATAFSGTAVRLQLDVTALSARDALIGRIVAEGEAEAATAGATRIQRASGASAGVHPQ